MKCESFNSEDLRILKSSLLHKSISYIFIFMVGGLILASLSGLIFTSKISSVVQWATFIPLLVVSTLIFLRVFDKWLSPNFKEIKDGKKWIIEGPVTSKSSKVRYAYSSNPMVDILNKPKFIEGYLEVEGLWFPVANENYNEYSEGDFVKIAISPVTRLTLSMEKIHLTSGNL